MGALLDRIMGRTPKPEPVSEWEGLSAVTLTVHGRTGYARLETRVVGPMPSKPGDEFRLRVVSITREVTVS